MLANLPTHFQAAIQTVSDLQKYQTYLGAFIFGSAARGEVNDNSDLDAIVIVSSKKTCSGLNHPFLNGIKVDISFLSQAELENQTQVDITKGQRIPLIAESIILFDKNGFLKRLRQKTLQKKLKKLSPIEANWIHFMAYNLTNKVKRHLKSDPLSALLSLHSSLNEVLKIHYRINRRWFLGSKRLLKDIRLWDPKLNLLLEKFLQTHNAGLKYHYWQKIILYVLRPLGGPKPISEIICDCPSCQKHLTRLTREK